MWKELEELDNRVFLFCINGKCMSGKIQLIKTLDQSGTLQIKVDFIEPAFFDKEIIPGNTFTIQEASRIIASGTIISS